MCVDQEARARAGLPGRKPDHGAVNNDVIMTNEEKGRPN